MGPRTQQKSLLFEIELPSLDYKASGPPRHRFMSSYEQKVDQPPDPNFQYLLFAAEPYETVGFKIPGGQVEVDRSNPLAYSGWDNGKKVYTIQVLFKDRQAKDLPGLAEQPRSTNLAFHGGGGFVR